MGLDPITSSWFASEVADETGNDASVPLAITAGSMGPVAQSLSQGNYEQAGLQTASQIPAIATAGATPGGSGIPWASIISGGAQLGGAYMNGQNAQAVAEINNRPPPTVPNPYYDAIMTRALGILDKYMQKHGITPTVGINPGQSPTAIGNPYGGAAPVMAGDKNELPVDSAVGAALSAAMGSGAAMPTNAAPSIKDKVSKKSGIESPKEDDGFTNAAMAAEIGARRMGITQDAPMFPTTRDFYEQDQERKKAELKKLNEYIYGQRSIGV